VSFYDALLLFAQAKMEIDICPRWILARLGIPAQLERHVGLLLSTLLLLALTPLVIQIPHFCLLRTLLGIPCPGCGLSHALVAVLHLKLAMSWKLNPAGLLVASTFCFQLLARPIAIAAPRAGNSVSQISHCISNLALGSLLLVWVTRLV
jgi:Protein of unknown function (DUF2752)